MSSRREFIRTGALAVSAAAGVAGACFGNETRASTGELRGAPLPSTPLYMVVFDDRLADSRAFAEQARARGVRAESFDNGDVTRLWYDDLYHRWRQGPAAIAGLTTPDALFVLQTFGNDARLRLQFKAEHRLRGDRIEHRLTGPDMMLRAAAALETSAGHWSSHMGRILSRPPAVHFGRSEVTMVSALSALERTDRSLLVSWVLAPRSSTILRT